MNEYLAGLLVLITVLGLCAFVVKRGLAFERNITGARANADFRVKEILATGVPMRAKVLSVSDTRMRVQPHHVYAFVRIEVYEPDEAEQELSGLVSIPPLHIPFYVPGREVTARVDLATKEFVIEPTQA